MEYKAINHVVAKKDSQALVTGQPVYTDDLRPKDCLIVKALRSPHARAIVKKVNKSAAASSASSRLKTCLSRVSPLPVRPIRN